MKWIIESALRLRLVVVILFGILLVAGLQVVRNTPLDVFPEFAPPYVEVQTEAPGLSTAEVEALVSVPLENALNGTPEVKKIRSKSVLACRRWCCIFRRASTSTTPGRRCRSGWRGWPPRCPAWPAPR